MVCCFPCFRCGKSSLFLSSSVCVAHLLLSPTEHSTASSVALPILPQSRIVCYSYSLHPSIFTFILQFLTKHLFFLCFCLSFSLCFFCLPPTPISPSFIPLCLMISSPQIAIPLFSIQTCSQQHKQSLFLFVNSFSSQTGNCTCVDVCLFLCTLMLCMLQ